MEAQIENAINIAWNPSSDQNLKNQALEFLNQLRSNPQGWEICLSFVVRDTRPSEIVRHVALDVLKDVVRTDQLDIQNLSLLRDSLMIYVRNTYGVVNNDGDTVIDSVNIQNKIAQTLTSLFVVLYHAHWTSFFHDMISLTTIGDHIRRENARGVGFYLRVLNAVHDEIADVMKTRSAKELNRDNELKDLIRVRDARMIALSWQEILSQWRLEDASIMDQCLAAIRRWVSWTDITLIVNEPLLNILFELVMPAQPGPNEIAINTIETFTEIIGKKMGADEKLELIDALKIKDVISQLIKSPALGDLRTTPDYDTDLAESVAKLVNDAMYDIIKSLDGVQDGTSTLTRANAQLILFLPFTLRFFSDEYDEICSTVIPSLTDLLALFRKKAKSNNSFYPENAHMLPSILDAILKKTMYDETCSWGSDDAQTDEAEFQELRKRLQSLQQAIAAIDEKLYLDTVSDMVIGTLNKFANHQGNLDWRELDLAMHELYIFGELVLKSYGQYGKGKPVSPAVERLVEMMFKLVNSDIASFPHPAIRLQYMQICVRYHAFFETNPQFIVPVLENYLIFIQHDHVKVQSRSWYLLYRFVKHIRQWVGDIVQNIIQAISNLLPIKAELPEDASDDGDMSSDENEQKADSRFTNQLYLYEAIGCICSAHAVSPENQVLYLRSVIGSIFTDLEAHLPLATGDDKRAILQIHHLIMAFGTLAKGFSDWTPANQSSVSSTPTQAVSNEFAPTAEVVLVALETLSSSPDIRSATRFALSRLIGVLGNRILPQLPRWIEGFFVQSSTKEEIATILRLLDQVIYGFKSEIFNILNTLLTPFLQNVFIGIGEPTSGTDDEIQSVELKREYLNFLLVILSNDLQNVLVSAANQPIFEPVITTIENLAKNISDFPMAKLALSVLTRMVLTWGGPDLPNQSAAPQPSLPGFDQFMMTRFSPLCWAIPTNPSFEPKDAQGRQALGEAAGLQKAIYTKIGQEYLTWVRDVELKGMGMNSGMMEEYLRALSTLDGKAFRHFFQALVQRSSTKLEQA